MKKSPIGVFDSGLGGLTVVKQIIKELPSEDIVYLGDTARVPYGTRGKKTIQEFSKEDARFLKKKKVKAIVIACHTASSVATSVVKRTVKIPVIDAVGASLEEIRRRGFGKIGILGTNATIDSGIYLKGLESKMRVFEKQCPLFVPLIEEGQKGKVLDLVIEKYLGGIKGKKLDALVLACTHYPLIKREIRKFVGKGVVIIDPSEEIAKSLKRKLTELDLRKESGGKGRLEIYVTDKTEGFSKIAERFLGKKVDMVSAKLN